MKDFITAAKAESADDFGFDIDFTLDRGTPHERTMVAQKPSEGQITTFLALAGDDLAANTEVIATSINFLYSLLDRDDRRYLKKRLMDRDDEFGGEDIAEILSYILEEWTGNPTGSRAASRRSRRPAGRSSTARPAKTA